MAGDLWLAGCQPALSSAEVSSPEEADVQLELWSYNPKLFEKDGLVDPFSLYLSLQDIKDERVEAALEKLIEENIC